MSGRTVIVGDVHGCADELDELLGVLALDTSDRLVFVGDLVAKGPRSIDVVQRVQRLGADCVRGNHDEHLAAMYRAERNGEPMPRKKAHHVAAYEQLGDPELAYLDALPLWLYFDDIDTYVVHAGLVPDVPIDAQDPSMLMNLRSIRPDGTPSTRIEEGVPWATVWPGPSRVVFGHDAVRGFQQTEHAIGLDTGCVYGRALTALVLPEERLVSVPSRRVWSVPKGKP